MKKNLLAFILISSFYFVGSAQTLDNTSELNPLVTGVPSLSITPDSRAGGMGDVGAATSPDVNSQFWNPAKYVFMESDAGVSLSYTPWLRKLVSDIDLAYLAAYWKFDQRQAVSASIRYFSLGSIELTNEAGDPLTTAQPNEFAVDAAYSIKLTDKLSAATVLRFIRSDLGNGATLNGEGMYPGIAVAADISTYYKTPITLSTGEGSLGLGLNISNIGSKISYDKFVSSNFIPTNLRLGASFDYPIDTYNKISVNTDINKLLVPTRQSKYGDPTDNNKIPEDEYNALSPIKGIFQSFSDAPGGLSEELKEIMWSVGAEYAYNNQFFVRAGYFNENQSKGNRKFYTAGAGFKLNVFQLDAAYVIATSQTNPLDQTLRFTLSFDLFGLKNLVK